MFSQPILGCLGNFTQLIYLNLSYNKFNQNIADQLVQFAQLCQLDLSHNCLEGEIPSNIDILQNLVMLNISHISGEIPSSFEDMKWLMYADVSFNQLQAPIPNSAAFLLAPIEAMEGIKDYVAIK